MSDAQLLQYLRLITLQLRGPVQQAIDKDHMASHLLGCITDLLGSLVAEREPDEPSRTADELAGLLEQEQQHWQRIHQHQRYAHAEGPTDREVEPMSEAELQRLMRLLRVRCEEGPSLAVSAVRALCGGFSKQTSVLTLTGNQRLPDEIVVRRDRAESPVGSTVLDEFELLRTLHAAGLSVPRPLAVDAQEVVGCPILITEKAVGRNIGDVYTIYAAGETNPLLALDLARELAKLHTIPLSRLPPSLPGMDSTHRASIRQEVEQFQADWQALGESSLTIAVAFQWLLAHLERLGEQRALVHRDARFHNILSQGPRVTALLDWELAAISHPARDIGYVYHHITQFADWQDFLAAYVEAGGTAPSELEVDFYTLWSDLFVAVYQYRARAHFLSGGTDNIQIAYAGEHMRQHSMHLLSTRLCHLRTKYPLPA